MISNIFDGYRIILASRSPRRQQLLKEIGINFEVVEKEYDESYPEGLDGEAIATYVSTLKARSLADSLTGKTIVITADTIVWCNNQVLGKPVDREDAKRILREISGNTHKVITGVSICSSSRQKTFSVSTKVTFNALTDEEIEYYIDNYKPYDKAGAYGIQEWIGLIGCSRIEGSYFNVVGLPSHRLYRELLHFVLTEKSSAH
jgi:septum formation protein